MIHSALEVRFYVTASGRSPVEEALEGLGAVERALVTEALVAIGEGGLRAVAHRQLEGRLWEIKITKFRVFYVLVSGPTMILLHLCKKQGQKARGQDIDVALKRLSDALKRLP